MGIYDAGTDYLKKLITYGLDADQWIAHTTIAQRAAAAANLESMSQLLESVASGSAGVNDRKVYVPASGDTTGVTDTAAIQDAIDSFAGTRGCVTLAGTYYLNDTLEVGQVGNVTYMPVFIRGDQQATLTWVGNKTDDYMLRYYDTYWGSEVRLQNLTFIPHWKARGLLVIGQNYFPSFDNLTVWRSRQVGIDIMGGWGSTWSNILVMFGRGYGIRTCAFNASQMNGCELSTICGMWHADNETTTLGTKTTELIDYAMQHGYDAAKSYYGDDLVEDWPADDDTFALNYDGNPFNAQNPVWGLRHSTAFFHGNCSQVNVLSAEQCVNIDDPIFHFCTATWQINAPRFEANFARLCKIGVERPDANTNQGVCNQFNNVQSADISGDYHECRSLFKTYGQTRNNVVKGVRCRAITDSVYEQDGRSHVGEKVEDVWSYVPEIGQGDWIKQTNGATHTPEPLVVGQYRITESEGSLIVQRYEDADGTGTGTSLDWVTKATLATP